MADGALDLVGLPERLRWLMDNIPREAGRRWTQEALARECASRGADVSTSAIAHLLSGRRRAPSAKLIGALADVFGVPVEYFLDETVARAVQNETGRLLALHAEWRRAVAEEASRGTATEPDK